MWYFLCESYKQNMKLRNYVYLLVTLAEFGGFVFIIDLAD